MPERQTDLQSVQDMLSRIHEVGAAPAPGMQINETAGFGFDGEIEIQAAPPNDETRAIFAFRRSDSGAGFSFQVTPRGPGADSVGVFSGSVPGSVVSTAREAFNVAERMDSRFADWAIAHPMSESASADPFSGFDPAVAHYIGVPDRPRQDRRRVLTTGRRRGRISGCGTGRSIIRHGANGDVGFNVGPRPASMAAPSTAGTRAPSTARSTRGLIATTEIGGNDGLFNNYGDEARKEMKEFIQGNGTQLAFRCRQFLKLWENQENRK